MTQAKLIATTACVSLVIILYPVAITADEDTRAQDRLQAVQDTAENRQEAMEEKMEARRNALMDRISKRQEEAKVRFEERQAQLKRRLATIKDEHKRAAVERINNKLAKLNEHATTRMSNALNKLTQALDRIEEKAKQAKESGHDTTAVDAAIKDARQAITTAQSAVETQAGKTYTLVITDEATLRNSVGQTVRQLKSDLRDTWGSVKDAKEAVVAAVRELAHVRSSSPKEEEPAAQ